MTYTDVVPGLRIPRPVADPVSKKVIGLLALWLDVGIAVVGLILSVD